IEDVLPYMVHEGVGLVAGEGDGTRSYRGIGKQKNSDGPDDPWSAADRADRSILPVFGREGCERKSREQTRPDTHHTVISGISPSTTNRPSVFASISSTLTPGARSRSLNPCGVTSNTPRSLTIFFTQP